MSKVVYSKLFEFETAVNQKSKTNYWPLIKGLDANMRKIRPLVDDVRKRLEPTPEIKEFIKEHRKVLSENSGASQEELMKIQADLRKKHAKAQEDTVRLQELEAEILADTVEIEFEPIPENLFHGTNNKANEDELRIDLAAFLLMSDLGIVGEPVEEFVPKTKARSKKKRK